MRIVQPQGYLPGRPEMRPQKVQSLSLFRSSQRKDLDGPLILQESETCIFANGQLKHEPEEFMEMVRTLVS